MKTTLNEIRKHNPCAEGWEKLLTYLGKTKADDEPISLLIILDSNGLNDALWCLRAVEGYDRELRLFAVWCARQVQHLLKDQRSLDALDVAERYANGQSTDDELTAARIAAGDAADAAEVAAEVAADAAAADWDADAGADAEVAAEVAARAAAWAAARDAANAAWDAVAASGAALDAAAVAAWAAWTAAGDAARAKQEAELRRICGEG